MNVAAIPAPPQALHPDNTTAPEATTEWWSYVDQVAAALQVASLDAQYAAQPAIAYLRPEPWTLDERRMAERASVTLGPKWPGRCGSVA